MAVETDNNGGNANKQTAISNAMSESVARQEQRSNTQQGAARMSTPEANRPRFSFRTTGRILNTHIARSPMSEVLTKLEAKFKEFYQPYLGDLAIKLITLDVNTVTEITQSCLIVAARRKNDEGDAVAYHTLILNGTGGELQNRFDNWQGVQYEIKRLASDVWDRKLRDFVRQEVGRQTNSDNLIEMDACVIPSDFPFDDAEASKALQQMVAANALIADNTQLEANETGFPDLNLADAQNDSLLSTRVLFNDAPTVNIVGSPVRADINIKMTAAGTQNSQNPDRVTDVAAVSAYLDVILLRDPATLFSPGFGQAMPYANFGQPQQRPPIYGAHMVITSMETAQLQTTAAQELALVQALMLRQDNLWTAGFMPRPYDNDVDLRDIGALGYEAKLEVDEQGNGKRIETKTDRFRPELFGSLMTLLFEPGLAISLDVSDAGPDTWYNGVFAQAAWGSAGANAEIIRSANVLSNGLFSDIYKQMGGTGRVVDAKENKIHLGKMRTPEGQVVDMRTGDSYVAIANMIGDKDLSILQQYSDTHLATNVPLPVRLAERARILTKLFNPSYEGYATRCTFEAKFLDALAEACHQAGLSLRPQMPNTGYATRERATAQFAGAMLMGGQASSGLFTAGFGQQQQSQGGYRPMGRWGA
jgi:hypothetical protein